jgi:acyl-CoA dehydrogenase
MSIDFTMPEQVLELRNRVRAFIKEEIEPAESQMQKTGQWREGIIELRRKARQRGLWLPQMPPEFGGLGLGPLGIAMISAECGRNRLAPFIVNCQAPDEGNMHTLLHFATPRAKGEVPASAV